MQAHAIPYLKTLIKSASPWYGPRVLILLDVNMPIWKVLILLHINILFVRLFWAKLHIKDTFTLNHFSAQNIKISSAIDQCMP